MAQVFHLSPRDVDLLTLEEFEHFAHACDQQMDQQLAEAEGGSG